MINKYDPSLIAISETWLKPGSFFKVPRYLCFRDDKADGYGGSAILVRNSVNSHLVNIPSHSISDDFSIVAVRLNNLTLISLYIPRPSINILRKILHILSLIQGPFIIMGDFNVHHPVWGCQASDSLAHYVFNIMDSIGLCLLNTGSPTRRTKPYEQISAVDLTLVSASLAPSMYWKTLSSSFGSDHFPILFDLPFSKIDPVPFKPLLEYRLPSSGQSDKWSQFSSFLDQYASDLPPILPVSLYNCHKAFVNCIHLAAKRSFPSKIQNSKHMSPPWWDEECKTAVAERLKAENQYCVNMTTGNYRNLIAIQANTKKILHTKKSEGWKIFCSSISPTIRPSFVWNSIRKFRGSYREPSPPYPRRQSWSDQFMDRLAPPYVPNFDNTLVCSSSAYDDSFSPFSMQELRLVLSSLKDSSPGPDGIPYSFLVNAGEKLLSYYLEMINLMLDTGFVPAAMKTQIIIPVLKPGKDPENPDSYRPIAMSSVLTKIVEHLIKNRLEWLIESRNILPQSQYGFRKGRGTLDSLSIFVTDIRLSFSRNESVVAAFLDICSAYDNVILSVLKFKMEKLGLPRKIINFIFNLFLDRTAQLRVDGEIKCSRSVHKGLPQGSVLSPILFNLYTYDLFKYILPHCRLLQYADDLVLYMADCDILRAADKLSKALESLNIWLGLNGLDIAPLKSSVVIFTRKRLKPRLNILFNNTRIPVENEKKFLGLILDSKLNFSSHIIYISVKCEKNLNILRCLAGVWWGAHPYYLKLLYNAIIRSVIDYASFLYVPACKRMVNSLDLLQARALRIITGAMKSTPKNAMQVECVDPPLDLRRQYLSDMFLFRLFQFSSHPLFPKLQLLLNYISLPYWRHKTTPCLVMSFSKIKNLKFVTHRTHKLPIFEFDYQTILFEPTLHLNLDLMKGDAFSDKHFLRIKDNLWHGWHCIFTDASKLDQNGCVGVGLFHQNYNIVQKIKCPPETSVFVGECRGIMEAINYILLFRLNKSVIFSDSLSALQAFQSNPFKIGSKNWIIFRCKELLMKCSALGYSVHLAWIPSHSNITGNEKADKVAKEAIIVGDKVPFKNYPQDLLLLPNRYLQARWSKRWTLSSRRTGSNYAKYQPIIPSKPWFFKFNNYNRKLCSMVSRMRFGHCCTGTHLHKLRIKDSSICECGMDESNLNHIFFSCRNFDHTSFFDSLVHYKFQFPIHIDNLLYNIDPPSIASLSSFISVNNIKL